MALEASTYLHLQRRPPYTLYRIPDLSPSQLTQGWAMVPLPSLYVAPPGSSIALRLGEGPLTPQPLQIRWELVPKGKEIQ